MAFRGDRPERRRIEVLDLIDVERVRRSVGERDALAPERGHSEPSDEEAAEFRIWSRPTPERSTSRTSPSSMI